MITTERKTDIGFHTITERFHYIEKSDLEKMRVYQLLRILRLLRAFCDRECQYGRGNKEELEKEYLPFAYDSVGYRSTCREMAKIWEVKEVLATRKHIMSKADRSKAFTKKQKRVLKFKMK